MKTEKLSYSYQGQDLILADLFRNITGSGVYVDIGCNHPVIESNTYKFYKMGWSGFGIDGESSFEKEWLKYRKRDHFINAVVAGGSEKKVFYKFANKTISTADEKTMLGYEKKHGEPVESVIVDTFTVENILAKCNIPRNFELLCCDIEGNDLEALQSVNFHKFRPKVVLVEIKLYNFYKPIDSEIVTFLLRFN